MSGSPPDARATRLVDVVFAADTNNQGLLQGGGALALMDKVAFIAAARHARVGFVTASCEQIRFEAPVRLGELIELVGRPTRVGRRSLSIHVKLCAEAPLTGVRRHCGQALFNMVTTERTLSGIGGRLPSLSSQMETSDPRLRMAELVLPVETSHLGSLHSGRALVTMAKAAFVAATRYCRKAVVMAAMEHSTFRSQIQNGEIVEFIPSVRKVGKSSMTVDVELWAENVVTGERRSSAQATVVMIALDASHRPTAILPSAA